MSGVEIFGEKIAENTLEQMKDTYSCVLKAQ